jgi:hypothetical protein
MAASPEKCVKSVDCGHVKASSFLLRKSAELKDLRVYIRIQVGTFLVYAFFHSLYPFAPASTHHLTCTSQFSSPTNIDSAELIHLDP